MDRAGILEKAEKIKEFNPNFQFGYINDPLSEEQVSEFETKHQIKLPEDYRSFLINLFDGGSGPYTILPLEFWDSYHDVYHQSRGTSLSEPFLLESGIEYSSEDPTFVDERLNDERYNLDKILNGTIQIAHAGCGLFFFLVVNGKEYGNIWLNDFASNDSIYPCRSPNQKRMTFSEWYNNWLDEELIDSKNRHYSNQNQVETVESNEEVEEDEEDDFDFEAYTRIINQRNQTDPRYKPAKIRPRDFFEEHNLWMKLKRWIFDQ